MLYVSSLHKSYRTGSRTYEVLKGVSLNVDKGEFVAVMGPSGSGKSTLLNCISCYIPYESGLITLSGEKLSGLSEETLAKVRNEKLGFVFQDFMLLDGLTVRENILLPRIIHGEVTTDGEKEARHFLDATIFMVTHDSFAASFCDRVVILRDGTVYRTLESKGSRPEFQDQLLDTIKEMSGDEI